MRILLAPNSFKGTFPAWEIAPAMEQGAFYFGRIRNIAITTRLFPISDGGTGFRRLVAEARGGSEEVFVEVDDPLGEERRQAPISILNDGTVVIESADFIGLALVPPKKQNPLKTSSKPLGQVLRHVIEKGHKRILIGGGDSSTCDGGLGLLQALGARIHNAAGNALRNAAGEDLQKVAHVDPTQSVLHNFTGSIEVACNLTSVASGPAGTAHIYAPQKGASPQETSLLAQSMDQYCLLLENVSGKPGLSRLPGTGSSGGITFPLMCFARDCKVKYSFEVTFPALNVDEQLDWADVVVTGEGLFDRNSVKGKAPVALALRAKKFGCTVVAIVGAIEEGITSRILRAGFDAIEPFTHQSLSFDYYSSANAVHLASEATTRALLQLVGDR